MKWIDMIKDVEHLYSVNNNILIQNKRQLLLLDRIKSIKNELSNSYYWRSYFYKKIVNGVMIFDSDLNFLFQYDLENLSGVIDIFDMNSFVLSAKEEESNFYYFIKGGKLVKKQPRFFGKILNEFYRINYSVGIFSSPRQFWCSDLFDERIYWEYTCKEGLEVNNQWFVWNDYLIFCEHKKGYYAGKLVMIHLRTGEIKLEKQIPNVNLLFDEHQGLLVSFWASEANGKNYQIIDLKKETIDIGVFETNQNLENVNTFGQIQFLKDNKLYFSDNVRSYGEEIRPIKFGCFDIETKKIDFLQEVPEAAGSQFAQVIYHEEKLYLRTTGNELFIFGEE